MAAAHGLETAARQFSYALDALGVHPWVHEHPLVAKQVRAGAPLDAVLEALTSEERTSLAQDLTVRHGASGEFQTPFGYADQELVPNGCNARVA